ncbi:UNVERIFIED_CONTAM: hypothetical protein Cloal_3204 [Acetivibrio alkalicellulosi]
MANKNDKNNIKDERIEDTTKYGEFISSFDQWMTPDIQRKNARRLAKLTENSDNKNDKHN